MKTPQQTIAFDGLTSYAFRKATPQGIHEVASNLRDTDIQECREITGMEPLAALLSAQNTSREILDPSGKVIAITGVRRECNVAMPWVIFRSDFKIPRAFHALAKQFVNYILDDEHHTVLVLKSAQNKQDIRFLKSIGLYRNPDVVLLSQDGSHIHEYILRKGNP